MLAEALGHMQRSSCPCPEDVKARITALRVPADEVTGTRMSTNWRNPGPAANPGPGRWSGGHAGHAGGGGGYRHGGGGYNGGSHAGGGGGYNAGGGGSHAGGFDRRGPRPPPPAAAGGGGSSPGGSSPGGWVKRPYIDRALAPRFGNKARADVTTEERMMDRIRDKMNKFSSLTYDATKTWLSQLLDSGETDFLTDFITLVFEKAASEQPFCALYARLITELCAGFPHLVAELRRIFNEFMDIFVEAAEEPDVAAAEYKAFLALRERRRYRRGYAAFIGEVAKLKALTSDDVGRTCNVILDQLIAAKVKDGQGLLCEEYADCLTALVKSCTELIRGLTLKPRVKEAMVKADSPSLTNKARFALMDITDLI